MDRSHRGGLVVIPDRIDNELVCNAAPSPGPIRTQIISTSQRSIEADREGVEIAHAKIYEEKRGYSRAASH
jgi:hypothetical protein